MYIKDNYYTILLIKINYIRYVTAHIPTCINFVLIIYKISTRYEQYVH